MLYGNGRCRGDNIVFGLDVALCCDGSGAEAGVGSALTPAFGIMDVEVVGEIGIPEWCVAEWPCGDGIVGDGGICFAPPLFKLFKRFFWPANKFPTLIR